MSVYVNSVLSMQNDIIEDRDGAGVRFVWWFSPPAMDGFWGMNLVLSQKQ